MIINTVELINKEDETKEFDYMYYSSLPFLKLETSVAYNITA